MEREKRSEREGRVMMSDSETERESLGETERAREKHKVRYRER